MTPQASIDPRLRRARLPSGLPLGEDIVAPEAGPVIASELVEPTRPRMIGADLVNTTPGGQEAVEARHLENTLPAAPIKDPMAVGTPAPVRTVHDQTHHGVRAFLGDVLKSALAGVGTVDPRASWQEKLGGLMGGAATGAIRPQTAHDAQYQQEYSQWAPKQQMAEEQAASATRRAHTVGEMSGVNPYTGKPTEAARARMVHEGDVANQAESLRQHRKAQEDEANARTEETRRARTVQEQELYAKNKWTVPPDVASRWGQPELAGKVLPKPPAEPKAGDWETLTDKLTGKMYSRNKLTGERKEIEGITGERQRPPDEESPSERRIREREEEKDRLSSSNDFETTKKATGRASAEYNRLISLPQMDKDSNGKPFPGGGKMRYDAKASRYVSEADLEAARSAAEDADAAHKAAKEQAVRAGWSLRDKDSAIDYKSSPKRGAAVPAAPQKIVTYKGQRHRVVKTNPDGSYELDPNPIQ